MLSQAEINRCSTLRLVGENSWITPKRIVDALGAFDLDPCCPPVMPWATATVMWTGEEDDPTTLRTSWQVRDGTPTRVWLNPPYGPHAKAYLARLVAHRDAGHGSGIAMLYVRAETAWWHDHVWSAADAILFLRGRVKFCHEDGTEVDHAAVAAPALAAYGTGEIDTLRRCGLQGALTLKPEMTR